MFIRQAFMQRTIDSQSTYAAIEDANRKRVVQGRRAKFIMKAVFKDEGGRMKDENAPGLALTVSSLILHPSSFQNGGGAEN
jgi:hypothetical protein